jgi:sentrin-specific protease 1
MILFQVDIFSKDLLLIPINRSYHWVLGAIDMKEKCIRVYDSMGGNHDHTLHLFLDYLELEHQDKKKESIDLSDWKLKTPKDIPQQENMSDCGVFTCAFAERLARRCVFDFSQQDMRLLRRRMVLNILNKKL